MPETPESAPTENKLPTGPSAALTFLYYFSGSALVATLLAVKGFGLGLNTGVPAQLSLLVGAVGGTLGAFYNRTRTLEVPFSSRKQFLKTLEETLAAMGYYLAEQNDVARVYQRSPVRQLFSGKIYVQIQAQQAILVSRAVHIRTLKKRLSEAGF